MNLDTRPRLHAMAFALALAALPLALPAPAAATTVGGGVAIGSVSFAGGGVPPLTAGCAPTSFTLTGVATGAAVHTVLSGFAGDIYLWGQGGSGCENAAVGDGTITLTASGYGPTRSELWCPALQGIYQRVLSQVVLSLVGTCDVNRYPAGNVTFLAHADFTPESGQGSTTPVTQATYVAEFSVVPL